MILPWYTKISEGVEHKSVRGSDWIQSRSSPLSQLDVEISADDFVTLSARDAAIQDILKEINRASETDMILVGDFDQRISIEISDTPLQYALINVLRDHSYILHYILDDSDKCNLPPGQLWVYSLDSVQLRDDEYEENSFSCEPSNINAHQANNKSSDVELITALNVEDPKIREDAVNELALIGKPAISALEPMINDEDENVRDAVVEALSDIGGDDSARALGSALKHEDAAFREIAVDALAEIGGSVAIQMLEKALQDPDDAISQSAEEHLDDLSTDANSFDTETE
jgi:hypothetical protein